MAWYWGYEVFIAKEGQLRGVKPEESHQIQLRKSMLQINSGRDRMKVQHKFCIIVGWVE